jgi:hypothetical protein
MQVGARSYVTDSYGATREFPNVNPYCFYPATDRYYCGDTLTLSPGWSVYNLSYAGYVKLDRFVATRDDLNRVVSRIDTWGISSF